MLSQTSEIKTFAIRWALALGWFSIFALLVYDPITPMFTDTDNAASPFRLNLDNPVMVQGQALPEQPYSMANRIFWTMVVPLVPLIIMVLGHGFWRRICPLSALMQIPRYLGFQRQHKTLNVNTGVVTASPAKIQVESWLAKNYWFIQFGLLWAGVSCRLLFYNADQWGLFFAMGLMVVSAVVTGMLFGGKTWCNYICPMAPVQKFYSEPGGVFESKAHVDRSPVTQSMCRDFDDNSKCVGCKTDCPDIDLEKHYWAELHIKGRRFFYYGFFGLVLGFYTYYYLYSGNWDYYFSGAWTHEESQLSQVMDPGFYINGVTIGIPKLIAAPLTTAIFILGSYLIGCLLENMYRRYRESRGIPLTRDALLHRMYCVSTYVTVNTFYLFGGRPNLALLPENALTAVDFIIVAFSTAWLIKAWQRSQQQYKKESMSFSLREKLKRRYGDLLATLDNRTFNDLAADEIYMLGELAPKLNQFQSDRIYQDIMQELHANKGIDHAENRVTLKKLREQLNISEEKHEAFLQELSQQEPMDNVQLIPVVAVNG